MHKSKHMNYLKVAFFVAMVVLLLAGCGGGSGGPAPTSGTITGKITLNANGLNGVTIAVTGSETATLVTDGSGAYSSSSMLNGTYTVTPSHPDYTFSPASQTVTVAGGSASAVFTATAPNTISGKISLGDGSGVPGVTMLLRAMSETTGQPIDGAPTVSTTTSTSGTYSITAVKDGFYQLIPSRAGYNFTGDSNIRINGADVVKDATAALASGGAGGINIHW
ncbi:hypothetical protein [Geobacter sp. SVR]|uniref:hypothetical protein n=1 Tax=Geobacter sp. SVR TaxID=2495594 RepID=UPI00143F0053|nr:hypothetical protein [Geobacter sp. SVR]BCS52101.1 hypothetical protein GSVR_04090 [Geobacter sp. SVR]GCF86556.1 hypothetical protein GSbR_31560 [Geobacter sp. SVR]